MSELCLFAAVSLAAAQTVQASPPTPLTQSEVTTLGERPSWCVDDAGGAIATSNPEAHHAEFSTVRPELVIFGERRDSVSIEARESTRSIAESAISEPAIPESENHLTTDMPQILTERAFSDSDATLNIPPEANRGIAGTNREVGLETEQHDPVSGAIAKPALSPAEFSTAPSPSPQSLIPPTSSFTPQRVRVLVPDSLEPSESESSESESSESESSESLFPAEFSNPADIQHIVQAIPIPQAKVLRPSSGSQFYQQRWVALQSGQSYTRLASDSFANRWFHSTYEPSHEEWVSLLAREARAMANGQGNNPLTVMVGDSISLWFPTDYMARYRFWLNQSISGDTAAGALQRLSLFSQTRPDRIHVMVGINDLRRGVSDQHLLNTQRQMMRRLRQQHPQAQVILHSILPTRLPNLPSDRIRRINHQLEAIALQEGSRFLDLTPYFSDSHGQLHLELTTDGLHLSPQGYALWYAVLQQLRLI